MKIDNEPRISAYIITFHESTGRSASLKLQSNFSAAMGSSVGSWYGETYSWARHSVALIRLRGSKTSIFSSRSSALSSLHRNFSLNGTRWRLGRLCTKRSVFSQTTDQQESGGKALALEIPRTFSLQMVSITSSGGVPSNSDDRELVDVCVYRSQRWNVCKQRQRTILPREERFPLQHLSKDTPCTPNIYRDVVFLPREHDLGSPIIARRHVARHLRILYSGETKITNLKYR